MAAYNSEDQMNQEMFPVSNKAKSILGSLPGGRDGEEISPSISVTGRRKGQKVTATSNLVTPSKEEIA